MLPPIEFRETDEFIARLSGEPTGPSLIEIVVSISFESLIFSARAKVTVPKKEGSWPVYQKDVKKLVDSAVRGSDLPKVTHGVFARYIKKGLLEKISQIPAGVSL